MMNRLYLELAKSKRKQNWNATESTQLLKKRASEIEIAEKKRRAAEDARQRLEKNADLKQQERTARAQTSLIQTRAAEADKKRIETMRSARHQQARLAYNSWLQTVYPTDVATKLIDSWKRASPEHKQHMGNVMKTALRDDRFNKKGITSMQLWTPDLSLTKQWAQARDPWVTNTTKLHWVRCSTNFRVSVIERCCPQELHAVPDAVQAFFTIFEMCGVPHVRKALDGRASWTALRILDQNGYIMEKAFIWGIRAFSTWLKPEHFPRGIHSWPPSVPESLKSEVEVPLTDDDLLDSLLPPQLRQGRGPASSGSTA